MHLPSSGLDNDTEKNLKFEQLIKMENISLYNKLSSLPDQMKSEKLPTFIDFLAS